MVKQIIIKCIYVELLVIKRLYPQPKLKHVSCNISSWKILTEWTHSLNHINIQSIQNNSCSFVSIAP